MTALNNGNFIMTFAIIIQPQYAVDMTCDQIEDADVFGIIAAHWGA